jgi:hypothetical protein
LLEYVRLATFTEVFMARISFHLLQQISRHISGVPAPPEDLAVAAAQLAPQLDGLGRLDELDLLSVEPATVVLPPSQEPRTHG